MDNVVANPDESNAPIFEATIQPESGEGSATANPAQQQQYPTGQQQDQSVILLSDSLEREPAPTAHSASGHPLVIPKEMVDIFDLEEIRLEVEVQVLSREIIIVEEGAEPPTEDLGATRRFLLVIVGRRVVQAI